MPPPDHHPGRASRGQRGAAPASPRSPPRPRHRCACVRTSGTGAGHSRTSCRNGCRSTNPLAGPACARCAARPNHLHHVGCDPASGPSHAPQFAPPGNPLPAGERLRAPPAGRCPSPTASRASCPSPWSQS
eukprot:11246887-Alexandrium_andersonii.AAC.1